MTEKKALDYLKEWNSQDVWMESPLCRLCASGNRSMISIYGEEGIRMALAYKINKHLPITVTPENKLPLEVCQDCVSELNASMNFVKKCMENQIKLRKLLNISVEDCDNEIQEIQEIKYQRKAPKRIRPPSKVILEQSQNKGNDHSLEVTIDKGIVNNYIKIEKESEILELVKDLQPNYLRSEVNGTSQEKSAFSSNEAELGLFLEFKSNDKMKVKTSDNYQEGAAMDVTTVDSVTKSDSHLRQFCKFCNEGFMWKADLFGHQTEMHPDLVFRCCFCLKVFYDKEEFYSHELAHRKQLQSGGKAKLGLRKLLKGNSSRSTTSLTGQKNNSQPKGDSSNKTECSDTTDGVDDVQNSGEIVERISSVEIPSNSFNENSVQDKQDSSRHLSCRYCPRKFSSSIGLKKHEAVHQNGKKKSFRCKVCSMVFISYHLLKKHESCHVTREKHQCEICLEFFTCKEEVEEHVQTHAGESSYLCELCGLNVESFVMFRLHRMDHLQIDLYKCNLCQKSFANATTLKNHYLIHSKKKKFICRVCKNDFPSADLLKAHKLSHEGEVLKCDVCNKFFTGYKKLKNHIQTHGDGRDYLCEKCGKDFKSNSSLHKHRYLCQVAIACTVCGKEFDCNTRLKVHMRMHTGEKPFVCSVCGKGFHASWSLSQHSATHTSVKIPCPLCGALFNRKSNMLTHKRRHRVPCGVCGKVFASIPILLAHQKSHEANGDEERDKQVNKEEVEASKEESSVALRCEKCGKLFMTALDLKAHISTHSNERPYMCDICGKSWRLQKTLKKHMVIHSGRQPYQCRYCPCTFLLHQRLVKHENGHTAGKPFSCKDCGQSFWTQLNLEKHTIRHCSIKIVEKKYECKQCDKTFETKSSLLSHKRAHFRQPTYGCMYCSRVFSQLRYARGHKCALDPNNQVRDTAAGEVFKSMPSLAEEESCSPDENTCPSVLNEEVVYDMDTVSPSYAEIIVISQGIDDIMVENSNELDNSTQG